MVIIGINGAVECANGSGVKTSEKLGTKREIDEFGSSASKADFIRSSAITASLFV